MRSIDDILHRGIETIEESIILAKYLKKKRHRCHICKHLSYYTQSVNGGPWYCYDGHFSTTGIDDRSIDGKPLWWVGSKAKGDIEFGLLVK